MSYNIKDRYLYWKEDDGTIQKEWSQPEYLTNTEVINQDGTIPRLSQTRGWKIGNGKNKVKYDGDDPYMLYHCSDQTLRYYKRNWVHSKGNPRHIMKVMRCSERLAMSNYGMRYNPIVIDYGRSYDSAEKDFTELRIHTYPFSIDDLDLDIWIETKDKETKEKIAKRLKGYIDSISEFDWFKYFKFVKSLQNTFDFKLETYGFDENEE